jgi:signal transduction histidine kinase
VRRRLLLVIAGAVAAAVTVVGLGTLLLTQLDVRHRNEDELERRVSALAAVVSEVRPARVRGITRRLQPALDADAVVVFGLDDPPTWIGADELEALATGDAVATRDGDTTYAAAPILRDGARVPQRALTAVDHAGADFGAAGRWFAVAGVVTVLLGVLVALRLARSLSRPLVAAEAATRRIAEGDLAARVPEPRRGDDELGRLVTSINEMAASLERAQRTERDFLLSVSHDLRTPLTSISGWAEALADGTAPDTGAAGRTILTEARRLDRLVRDLLDLARLQAHAFTLRPEAVDLRDVATGTAEGLRPDLEDSGLVLEVAVPATPVIVAGDADRLAQIAGNLLENAGRHAARVIRVEVATEGADAVLVVTDDGVGIPPDTRAAVFERLHADVRPTARTGQGTGLGLAIVRELARAMGGDVDALDADGGGARLLVRLPLA